MPKLFVIVVSVIFVIAYHNHFVYAFSSQIPVWLNDSVFIYKLSGGGFEFHCSQLSNSFFGNTLKVFVFAGIKFRVFFKFE